VNYRTPQRTKDPRQGAAAVELAICLPVLMLLFMITLDWARLYYYDMIIANCARQGALWASSNSSDPCRQLYPDVQSAALAEYGNFTWPGSSPVASASGTDPVTVTVTWNIPQNGLFPSYTPAGYPGFTMPASLSRSVTMTMSP
jgi:Flp pilus assembly protein TadG